jgi:hypothetical protein
VGESDRTPIYTDERELLLSILDIQREHVIRTVKGLSEEQVRWHPDDALLPLIGIVNHLTRVEWRWIDGRYLRAEVTKDDDEFIVLADRTIEDVVAAYRARAEKTARAVLGASITAPCLGGPGQPPRPGIDLRWVLLHLIQETAHHAGHADATRELLDGSRMT